MTGPPELDVAAIRAYCEQRVPPHARDDVRVELEFNGNGNGNGVTIVGRRGDLRLRESTPLTDPPVRRFW